MEIYNYLIFFNYLWNLYSWTIFQITFIALWIIFIRKFKVRGESTALFGFILLSITMIFSIFGLDAFAGRIAEYVWIVFAIAFMQEFYHFLKHENKHTD